MHESNDRIYKTGKSRVDMASAYSLKSCEVIILPAPHATERVTLLPLLT